MTKIVLFQPDIAGNVGTIIRTCVCFDLELHIIEPCGFPFDIQRIKKSALDYIDFAKIFIELRSFAFDHYHNGIIISNSHALNYFDNVIKYWDDPDSYYQPSNDFKPNNYVKQKYLDNYEYNFVLLLKNNKKKNE